MSKITGRLKTSLKAGRIWLVFLLLFLMVPLFALTIIAIHGPNMQKQTLDNLSAVAQLKAYQINNWLQDQKKAAKIVAENDVLFDYVERLLHGSRPEYQKTRISGLLGALQQLYRFESIVLIRPDGELLLEVGDPHQFNTPEIHQLLAQSLKDRKIIQGDFDFTASGLAHMDIMVPLVNRKAPQNPAVAYVLLHIDPNHFIFPYLSQWPSASQTSETLLVRQKGRFAEFVSPLKYSVDSGQTQLLMKRPMTETSLPAVMALKRHRSGVMKGLDYRGTPVLAAYTPVIGSQWMIVSKIDEKEATQSLRDLVFWVSLVAFLSLMVIGIAFIVVLKKQRHLQKLELAAEKTQAERILHKFFDLPFIGMAILDSRHDSWVRFNPKLPEILGYTPETLSRKKFEEVFHPHEVEDIMNHFSAMASQESDGFTQEVRLLDADGHTLFGRLNVKCIRHRSGRVQFYFVTIQDVTELRQLAELSLEHQHHLNALIHTIPDLVWLKDVDGVYLSCNPSFESFFGAKESEIVGKTDYDFVDKALADFFRENDCKAMEAEQSTENEEWLTFASTGYKGLFSTVKTPMKDENGNVIGVLGVARDISRRKADEQRLERLTKLYSAMSHTNEAIVRCTHEDELFTRVCEIAVEEGGMNMAWIGMIDTSSHRVYPVSKFGENSEYLDGLEIAIDDNLMIGQGPTGIAIREDRPYWCQDFQHDPHTQAWHQRAEKFGWQSSASIPLHQSGEVIGTLNLYSDVSGAFDEPTKNLLTEMATDISFALNEFAHEEERKRIEASRQEAFDRLKKLAGQLPGMIYQFRRTPDGKMSFPFVSDAIDSLFGVKPEEVSEEAGKLFEKIHPDDLAEVMRSIEESAKKLSNWYHDFRVISADGNIRWLSGNSMPQKEPDGSILWHGFTSDVTAHKQAEAQIELASKVFEQSQEGIMITDPDQKVLMVNEAFTKISGYPQEEILGKTPRILASGRHSKYFYDEIWQQINETGHWQGEIWNRRKNGEIFPEWLSISCGYDEQGQVTEYIGIFNDISQVKESEEKIQHLAHYDPLTELANREMLMDRLNSAIHNAEKSESSLALLFIDLDNFKNVNDTLGHQVGDRLLIEVGQRVKQLLRSEDTLARQGGDEFIAVLPDKGETGAAHIAEKIIQSISAELDMPPYSLFITPSIGIAIYPQDGLDADELLRNADTAMYQAKEDGRNAYRFFTPEMQAHSARIMRLESSLRVALVNNQLSLYYQPQICAETGKIVGMEALIRWNHPEMGWVSPEEFIPVAEQSGQILTIGSWVLRTAVRQIKAWKAAGKPCFPIAVNLSAIQFRYEGLPEQIMSILSEEGVDSALLELELTESVAMANPDAAVEMMDKLAEKGIALSIDDFGTGYSSLSYLKRFKASKLKIDQSFVRDLMEDADDRSIIKAIISLAKSLGLNTIAEGVETKEQLDFLKQQGCDEIQGYYFSKPLTPEAFEAFSEQHESDD